MSRTSQTHPIRVDAVPIRDGFFGLTFCPGKHGDSLNGAPWARDLETDLAALKVWGGTDLVVTLMERHEFELLRVPEPWQTVHKRLDPCATQRHDGGEGVPLGECRFK